MPVVAVLFVIGAVVFVHIAAWGWIRLDEGLSYFATAGILGGIDLLIALILVALASRSGPSRVEREALDVRNRAIEGVTSALTLSQLAIPRTANCRWDATTRAPRINRDTRAPLQSQQIVRIVRADRFLRDRRHQAPLPPRLVKSRSTRDTARRAARGLPRLSREVRFIPTASAPGQANWLQIPHSEPR